MSTTPRSLRIGLVVDHPLRDLHGIVLVAHLLARAGHSIIIMPFYGQSFDLRLVELDLLVLNYVRPANLDLIREAQRRGIPLAVLDTEGGLIPADGPTSHRGVAEFMRRTGLDETLSLYMFWGPAFRDAIVSLTALESDRARVTGCPRFDLAHPPWCRDSAERDIVLINTNFAGVNSAHAADGEMDRGALRSIGFDEERLERMIRAAKAIMDDTIDAIAKIVAARPERRFVLRPHPFERDEPYRRRFAGVPNIEIHREGSVLDVLAKSASLLHVNCTTAVEAAMSGVPPISLEFANREEMRQFAEVAGRVSHHAGSVEEALALLDRGRALGPAAGADVIAPAFGPSDGRAAERAADAIVWAARNPRPTLSPHGARYNAAALKGVAGRVFGSSLVEAIRSWRRPARRDKTLRIAEVGEVLARFASAQGVAEARVTRMRSALGLPAISLLIHPTDRSPGANAPLPRSKQRLSEPSGAV